MYDLAAKRDEPIPVFAEMGSINPVVILPKAVENRHQEIAKTYRIDIGSFGHAGDGNLHPTILTDRRDKEEFKRVEEAIEAIFDKALSMGGTLSGEHGTGIAKAPFLEKETGFSAILFSRQLRQALDPHNILNPGKITGVSK